MNPYTQAVILTVSAIRMLPHIAMYAIYRKRIDGDLEKYGEGRPGIAAFVKVCTRQRVFRNIFYYRIGEYRSALIKWLLPPERTLNIWCPYIGEGAHFEHNYATYLNAESIGRNFYCLHLVTLGNGRNGRPVIGDNVKIFTGATVYGNIRIGNDVTIGAGAVVCTDVPDGCVAKGNPAVITRKAKH